MVRTSLGNRAHVGPPMALASSSESTCPGRWWVKAADTPPPIECPATRASSPSPTASQNRPTQAP